jgi:hypothetical protein
MRTLTLLVLVQAVGTAVLDFTFKARAAEITSAGKDLVRFFALFHTATSVGTIAAQAALAGPLLARAGLSRTLSAFPASVALGSAVAALVPSIGTVVFARGVEQSVRSSVFRSAYELLFAPLSALEKRSAKPLIDIGAERAGDIAGAAFVQLALIAGVRSGSPFFAGAAAVFAVAAFLLTRRLRAGWFRALERSLEEQNAGRAAGETAALHLGESMLLSLAVPAGHSSLSAAPAVRRVDDLIEALHDSRFEVRARSGRALARLTRDDATLVIDAQRVEDAIVLEAGVGRQVWAAREFLARDESGDAPFELEWVRDRSTRSLEHVFTLLSLILPREPLRVAYRGLHTRDPRLRGTALEYLEAVLPPRVKDVLWPHLDDAPRRREAPRSAETIVQDLMGASETIALRIEKLRDGAAERPREDGSS